MNNIALPQEQSTTLPQIQNKEQDCKNKKDV